MATITVQRNRLTSLANREVLVNILFEEIKRFEQVFINLNKKQLTEGESSSGEIFGTYSQFTEDIARLENPRTPKVAGEPYNFEWTGGLFDGMRLDFGDNSVSFTSDDEKTAFLKVKYKGLFGLQPENLKTVVERVLFPAFMLQIRKRLALS